MPKTQINAPSKNKFKKAGYVNVKGVKLYSMEDNSKAVDLTDNYGAITINEGMQSAYLEGYIDVVDAYGMMYSSITNKKFGKSNQFTFPQLRGEEFLLLTYQDDRSEKIYEEQFFVYAVDDIRLLDDTKETALQYRLFFCSPQKFFANTRRIRKAYRNMTISEMVESIFEEYYTDIPVLQNNKYKKEIECEDTTGTYTIVIPNLTPEEAILFLARRAYSSTNKSSFYFFFETREKFWFATHEYLAIKNRLNLNARVERDSENPDQNPYHFEYTSGADDNTPEGQIRARQVISRPTLSPVNSAEHVRSSGYRKNLTEIDILNRKVNKFTFEYKDNFSNFNNIDDIRLNNSEKFIDAVTNKETEDYIFIKDYKTSVDGGAEDVINYNRKNPFYLETRATKSVFFHHFNDNKLKGAIKGRKQLYPGDIINIRIPEFSVNSMNVNQQLDDRDNSGTHIVMSLEHLLVSNVWETRMHFTKAGKAGGPASIPNQPLKIQLRQEVRPGQNLADPFQQFTYLPQNDTGDAPPSYADNDATTEDVVEGTIRGPQNNVTGVKGNAQPIDLSASPGNVSGRAAAEEYLGRSMSDSEWEYLVRTTAGETGQLSGVNASTPEERANVAAVILNRVKSSSYPNTVEAVVKANRQFAPVTGWSGNGNRASDNFLAPSQSQIDAVTSNIAQEIGNVNSFHLNFTATNLGAYKDEGTNSGFIQDVANDSKSQIIGQHIFGTA